MALEFRFHSSNAPCEQSKGSGAPWAGPWSGPRRPHSLPRECAGTCRSACPVARRKPPRPPTPGVQHLPFPVPGKDTLLCHSGQTAVGPQNLWGAWRDNPVHVSRAFQTPRRARFLSGTSLCLQLPAEHKKNASTSVFLTA